MTIQAIVDGLSNIKTLKIISRTSNTVVFTYKAETFVHMNMIIKVTTKLFGGYNIDMTRSEEVYNFVNIGGDVNYYDLDLKRKVSSVSDAITVIYDHIGLTLVG